MTIVKGRAECLLALLECTLPNASPRSKVACGKLRDKLIEPANVAHCSGGGVAEAVLLRRRYVLRKKRPAPAAEFSRTGTPTPLEEPEKARRRLGPDATPPRRD